MTTAVALALWLTLQKEMSPEARAFVARVEQTARVEFAPHSTVEADPLTQTVYLRFKQELP